MKEKVDSEHLWYEWNSNATCKLKKKKNTWLILKPFKIFLNEFLVRLTGIVSILQVIFKTSILFAIDIMTKCSNRGERKADFSWSFISIIFMKIKMQFRYQTCQDCNLTLALRDKSIKYFNLHCMHKISMNHLTRPLFPPF